MNVVMFTQSDLRKISALLLCEMTYRSDEIKKKMVAMLKLFPAEGRVKKQ